jgi:ABC-2 type transport system permease protein
MNLLRSEWIKLLSVRTTWVTLGIGLLAEALFAGLYVGLAPLEELARLEDVMTGVGLLLVLILVLGVLAITTEFRHGTASSTFLVTPQRWPVLVAKLAATFLVGLLAGLAFVLVNGGLALPLLSSRGGTLPSTSDAVSIYAGVVVSLGLLCVFGFGVGAVVRNQVGAIIAAIAFFFIISPLPELLPGSIGDYFPAQAIGSMHGNSEGDSSLGQVAGGFVLAAWSLGLVAIGTLLVCRRDVGE